MVAVPRPAALNMPVEEVIVPTADGVALHEPPDVLSVIVVVPVAKHNAVAPVMATGMVFTVTVVLAGVPQLDV